MGYQPSHFELPSNDTWPGNEDSPPYLFTEDIAVAVDVAMATRRPLLIAGPPGSGKSMLAPAMAGLGIRKSNGSGKPCRYLQHTFTSRSRLGELTSELDHLRRLHDAQTRSPNETQSLLPAWAYREPGKLWWAFDPQSAKCRGKDESMAKDLGERFQWPEIPRNLEGTGDIVLLLDEIDKAEPDLPNDLLEPLDRMRFDVPGVGEVRAPEEMKLLVIITTNGERELPPAFLRRCVSLVLKHPGRKRLLDIGKHHFPKISKTLLEKTTDRFIKVRKQAYDEGLQRLPSTSEFIDAIRATRDLKLKTSDPIWDHVQSASLLKRIEWVDELPDEDSKER